VHDPLRARETIAQSTNSPWTKSTLSHANGNCVEVADLPGGQVGVRHSKDAGGLVLRYSPEEWWAFLSGVRNGEFDISAT